MRPALLPRLVNGPFDDPVLFIRFLFENRALMFDLGEIYALSTRDLLKLTHVFVTHTHMDHFIGFDRLLRVFLGREKRLHIFGPRGFIENIEGKLAAYQWNLVDHFTHLLTLQITEVRSDTLISKTYPCQNRFRPVREAVVQPIRPHLVSEPALRISATLLDHRIPCLGFSVKERFHINIKKDGLKKIGLLPGPWLTGFKQALFEKRPPDSVIETKHESGPKNFPLGELSDIIAVITPGQKITYITDAVYSPTNVEKMISFAEGSDHLFIEAAFLQKDAHTAAQKYHLTAHQAGRIAAWANVKRFTPFHYSPRYTGLESSLWEEAMTAYACRAPIEY
jgi:ribonuclease Z